MKWCLLSFSISQPCFALCRLLSQVGSPKWLLWGYIPPDKQTQGEENEFPLMVPVKTQSWISLDHPGLCAHLWTNHCGQKTWWHLGLVLIVWRQRVSVPPGSDSLRIGEGWITEGNYWCSYQKKGNGSVRPNKRCPWCMLGFHVGDISKGKWGGGSDPLRKNAVGKQQILEAR